jgi:hypothetical protein
LCKFAFANLREFACVGEVTGWSSGEFAFAVPGLSELTGEGESGRVEDVVNGAVAGRVEVAGAFAGDCEVEGTLWVAC